MKTAIVMLSTLLAASMASDDFFALRQQQQQEQQQPPVAILHSSDNRDEHGGYSFGFESANGIVQQESGSVKAMGEGQDSALVKTGSFSWTSPDGTPFQLSYIADETGFHPQGQHLPIPPPTPKDILPSLALVMAAQEQPRPAQHGQRTVSYAAPDTQYQPLTYRQETKTPYYAGY